MNRITLPLLLLLGAMCVQNSANDKRKQLTCSDVCDNNCQACEKACNAGKDTIADACLARCETDRDECEVDAKAAAYAAFRAQR